MVVRLQEVHRGHEVVRIRVVVAVRQRHHQPDAQEQRDNHSGHAVPEELMYTGICEKLAQTLEEDSQAVSIFGEVRGPAQAENSRWQRCGEPGLSE